MFARKFARRTGALECGCGDLDLNAVRLLAAALTFTPNGVCIGPEVLPVRRFGQLLAGFGGSRVRCQREYLIGGERHDHALRSVVGKAVKRWRAGVAMESQLCGDWLFMVLYNQLVSIQPE